MPSLRFTTLGVPYRLPDHQTVVTDSLEALVTNGPVHPIDQNEYGETVSASDKQCDVNRSVWAGMLDDGTFAALDCYDWSSPDQGAHGKAGHLNATQGWSGACNATCDRFLRLYCFEQGP